MVSPFPCCPVNRECHVKGNPDRKNIIHGLWYIDYFCITYCTLTIMAQPPEQNSEAATRSVLKSFANFTYSKTPVLESPFYKVASLQVCNVIKKRLLHRCFPVKFEKFLRTPILKNICEQLLLCIDYFIMYWFLQFTTVNVFTKGENTLWNISFRAFHEIRISR